MSATEQEPALSTFSEPIGPQWHEGPPFQWRLKRIERTEQHFQRARDETVQACLDKAKKETEDRQRARDLEDQRRAQAQKVARYEHCCRLSRASVDETVTKCASDTVTATNPSGHALRFPLYTALRPLVVLANPAASPCPDPPPPPPSPAQQLLNTRSILHRSPSTAHHSTSQTATNNGLGASAPGQSSTGQPALPQLTCSSHPSTHPCSFGEALFVRGLVASLMANACVVGDVEALASMGLLAGGSDTEKSGGDLDGGGGFEGLGDVGATQSGEGSSKIKGAGAAVPPLPQQPQQQQQWQAGAGTRRPSCSSTLSHRGMVPLMSPGCRGTDLVWWDAVQPKMALADAPLARLEVLRSCAVAVMVLTQNYATSKVFPNERDMAMARLAAAQRQQMGQDFTLIVVRLECMDLTTSTEDPARASLPPPHFGPLPTPPPRPSPPEKQIDPCNPPEHQKSEGSVEIKTEPEPPFPIVEVLVTAEGPPEAQVARALAAIRDALLPAGVALAPIDELHITFSPEDAVTKVLSGCPPPPTPPFRTMRSTLRSQTTLFSTGHTPTDPTPPNPTFSTTRSTGRTATDPTPFGTMRSTGHTPTDLTPPTPPLSTLGTQTGTHSKGYTATDAAPLNTPPVLGTSSDAARGSQLHTRANNDANATATATDAAPLNAPPGTGTSSDAARGPQLHTRANANANANANATAMGQTPENGSQLHARAKHAAHGVATGYSPETQADTKAEKIGGAAWGPDRPPKGLTGALPSVFSGPSTHTSTMGVGVAPGHVSLQQQQQTAAAGPYHALPQPHTATASPHMGLISQSAHTNGGACMGVGEGTMRSTSSYAVDPSSRLRNGLMRLSLTATRGTPEEDDALSKSAMSSLVDGPYEPGASWVASHSLVLPKNTVKPVMEWSCHDVQVWVSALGKSVSAGASEPLLLYGIDGALLHMATPADLQVLLGVTTGQQLKASLKKLPIYRTSRPSKKYSSKALEETPLFTLSDQQLEQVFADVVRYYDSDMSGDLNSEELFRLLHACGLKLSRKEVSEVRDEYDYDEDNRLDSIEAALMLWDVWRLLLASRDAAAWNVPAGRGGDLWEGTTEYESTDHSSYPFLSQAGLGRMSSRLTRKSLGGGKADAHSTVWRWAAGRAASIAYSRAASRAVSRAGSMVSRATSRATSQAPRSVHGAASVASSRVGRAAYPGGLTADDLKSLSGGMGGTSGGVTARGGTGGGPGAPRGMLPSSMSPRGGGILSRRTTKEEGGSSVGAVSGAGSRSTVGAPARGSIRISGTTAGGGSSTGTGDTIARAKRGVSIAPQEELGRGSKGGSRRVSVGGSSGMDSDTGDAEGKRHMANPLHMKRLLSRIQSMGSSPGSDESEEREGRTGQRDHTPPSHMLASHPSMGRVSFAVRESDRGGDSFNQHDNDSRRTSGAASSKQSAPRNVPHLVVPMVGTAPKPLPPPGAHSTHQVMPEPWAGATHPTSLSSHPTRNQSPYSSLGQQPVLPTVNLLGSQSTRVRGGALSQSKRPLRLQALGGKDHDDDDSSADGSSMGSTLATDLDVFGDFALTSARELRATTDAEDLMTVLRSTLKAADLRRVEALSGDKLRGALVVAMGRMALSGSSPDTAGADARGNRTCTLLTPYELRLLSNLRPPADTWHSSSSVLQATGSTAHAGDQLVPINSFVPAAADAVARSQDVLMDVVYGPRGTQNLLIQLHAQLYPSSNGQMKQVAENFKATGAASHAALRSSISSAQSHASFEEVPFEEAPQLLGILTKKLSASLPSLVRAGILQEAAAAAEQCVGTGNEVSVWACIVSHMLHIFVAQQKPEYSEHYF